MKGLIVRMVILGMVSSVLIGCASSRRPPKRGCPTSSSNMGAEKVLAGEKPEKKSKFKVKQMN